MKTAVIYARYSSAGQTEQSIEGQLRECYEYAKYNDIAIVGTYIDRAMTGTNDNRTDFQRMLKDAQKADWDMVLVYKLDRFSRNKYEMAIHKKTLKDRGIQVVSAKEHIPEGPEGIILESLLEGMAEYYSVELAQKVSRGQKETRIKGNYFGGGIPYGYKVVNKKYVVCEEQATVINRIFEMYIAGTIAKDIVKTLTDEGITQTNGKPFETKNIYRILRNERYTGIYRHHNEGVYTNMFPRIIPDHLFLAAKSLMRTNKVGGMSNQVIFLLRSKMKCGYCGSNIVGESGTSRTGAISHYYKCGNRKKSRKNCMQACAFRKDMLEQLITDVTLKAFDSPSKIDELVNKIFEAHEKRIEDTSIMNILIANRDRIKKALDNVMAAVEQGIVTATTKQRIEELEQEYDVAQAKVVVEENKNQLKLTPNDVRKYILKCLKKEPRYMLKAFIKEIIVYNDKVEIYFNYIDSKRPDDLEHQAFSFYTETVIIDPTKYDKNSRGYIFDWNLILYI